MTTIRSNPRRFTWRGDVCVLENLKMSKQTAVKIPEEETRNPKTALQPDVPDHCPREEVEFVDDPGFEEEADGYGYGV